MFFVVVIAIFPPCMWTMQQCPPHVLQLHTNSTAQASNVPAQSPNAVVPEEIQTLRAYFQLHLRAHRVQPETPMFVNTWYLNHDTAPSCYHARRVRLSSDPSLWTRQITDEWRDRIDHRAACQFYLVRPTPPRATSEWIYEPHLIVEQLPGEGRRSVLISSAHLTRHPGEIIHWATVLPQNGMTKSDVVLEANALGECSPLVDERRCQVLRGDHQCRHGIRVGLSPGDSLFLQIQEISEMEFIQNREWYRQVGL